MRDVNWETAFNISVIVASIDQPSTGTATRRFLSAFRWVTWSASCCADRSKKSSPSSATCRPRNWIGAIQMITGCPDCIRTVEANQTESLHGSIIDDLIFDRWPGSNNPARTDVFASPFPSEYERLLIGFRRRWCRPTTSRARVKYLMVNNWHRLEFQNRIARSPPSLLTFEVKYIHFIANFRRKRSGNWPSVLLVWSWILCIVLGRTSDMEIDAHCGWTVCILVGNQVVVARLWCVDHNLVE